MIHSIFYVAKESRCHVGAAAPAAMNRHGIFLPTLKVKTMALTVLAAALPLTLLNVVLFSSLVEISIALLYVCLVQ